MAYVKPTYSKGQVDKVGGILVSPNSYSFEERLSADAILANWRACHGYSINTFPATLRLKLREVDKNAIVAQRMKRAPSISLKLQRFDGMRIACMQDIGGLRAIVSTVANG